MKSTNRSFIPAIVAAALAFGVASAAHAGDPHHTIVMADAVQWGPAPPSLPPGAQAAVLAGNPGKAEPFILRLKLPAGYTIPPHRHSTDEMVTVIAGAVKVGAGEKLVRGAGKELSVASFVNLPAGMAHYAWVEGETVLQINATGPFDVIYVNPKDDPRKL